MGKLSEERTRREAAQPSNAVREPIKQMTGFESEAKMAESLPLNTMQADDGKLGFGEAPRRKRRTKAEMDALRSGQQPDIDPNMADPRYRKAVEKMRSAGISTTVKAGFETAAVATHDDAWKLAPAEVEDVEDFSYVVSKKYAILDPTQHWISMAIYFLALLGTLIFKRAAKQGAETWLKKITSWFTPEEETKDAQERQEEKAESV